MKKYLYAITTLLFFLTPLQSVLAQGEITNPFYIIQPGETLYQIAINFGVTLDEIISLNNIENPDFVSPGTQIYIPGLSGISGEVTSQTINIGENFRSIIHKTRLSADILIKLNRKTSPSEIYAGSSLIFPINDSLYNASLSINSNESIFENSVLKDVNPWIVILGNSLDSSFDIIPFEIVFFPTETEKSSVSSISPLLNAVTILPLPLVQGNTVIIQVTSKEPVSLEGNLNGFDIHFFQSDSNEYYALQGVHAMADLGMAPFSLSGSFENGQNFSFQQNVLLKSGNYSQDPPIYVKDETIDPANTKPEDDFIRSLTSTITPEKYWSGSFIDPVDAPVCYKSVFGSRRSYNDSDYNYFHTGLDYGVCAPSLNIYAAEEGKVVFAGPLTVRGTAVFIDHGQGIFSGYFHLSELKVSVGEIVEKGKLIGFIGATGRVTGPHLHFEIWVNGVQVDPYQWIINSYP